MTKSKQRYAVSLLGLMMLGTSVAAQPEERRAPTAREIQILEEHNRARFDAGVKPMEWSDRLEAEAQKWADHLARNDLFEHAPPEIRKGQGENIWQGTRGYRTDREKIGDFISEKRYFRNGTFPDISTTGRWSDVGHYSQIIWPDTREVGCAISETRTTEYLVCRYWPAGNMWGQRISTRQEQR